MRTEVEVAADTVLALRMAELLTSKDMANAARVAGVTMQDLADSHARYQRRGGRHSEPLRSPQKTNRGRPPGSAAAQPVPAPTPAPIPKKLQADKPVEKNMQRRERKEIDGITHLLCKGCNEWLPTDSFLMRSDRPGIRVSRCSKCRRIYQRERRVSAAVLDDLKTIGLRIVLDPDSNIVGVQCSICEKPFESGQVVDGEADLHHAACAP